MSKNMNLNPVLMLGIIISLGGYYWAMLNKSSGRKLGDITQIFSTLLYPVSYVLIIFSSKSYLSNVLIVLGLNFLIYPTIWGIVEGVRSRKKLNKQLDNVQIKKNHSVKKKIVFLVFIGILLFASYSYGVIRSRSIFIPEPTPISSPNYTGQELFDAVNNYRQEKGLTKLSLNKDFCNNIVSRWEIMSNPNTIGHEGFEEWSHKYLPQGVTVSEIAGPANTPQELINSWLGSPSHRISLENPKNTVGCAYAGKGYGVVELGWIW